MYHIDDPKTAALIFRSGKIVCTGAKGIDEVREGIEKAVQDLNVIGMDASSTAIKVENIVASADLHAALNLYAIALGLGLER